MKLRMDKVTSLTITILLLASLAFSTLPPVHAQTTTLSLIPTPQTVSLIGQQVTLACVVEDVSDLYGVGLQITWNTTYFDYVSHTMTMPWNDSTAVIPPSPYAGLMYSAGFPVSNIVNAGAGTYDAAYSSASPAPSFYGDGTAFVITLDVKFIPFIEDVGADFLMIPVSFTLDDVANSAAQSIPHTTNDAWINMTLKPFEYPPEPLLKVTPAVIECTGVGENVTADVYLMGADHLGLDPFWDVSGIDVYMNFDPTMLLAVDAEIDPDGWFAAFWHLGVWEIAKEIDNTEGFVHIAFMGYGEPHTAPYDIGRMFSVTFQSLSESDTYPPGSSLISLENPPNAAGMYVFDSKGGLINIGSPTSTLWTQLTPKWNFGDGPFELLAWDDEDSDSELSVGDIVQLEDTTTSFYFDYLLTTVTGTLNLTHTGTAAVDDYVWAASFGPDNIDYSGLVGRYIGTDDPYNGYGVPNWTGNFSTLAGSVTSVNSITVTALPFTADEYNYTLTEGVHYLVHADDELIELLTPVDVDITNELWVDGVNNSLNGWPFINYVASGISSVYVDMMNGTARFGVNNGYAMSPPAEWWFDPDFTWELEGWWALGYYCPASYCWPAGSMWWINYTAASYLTVDYVADPEPEHRFIEYDGTYADFLSILSTPNGTHWKEIYPNSLRDQTIMYWDDVNTNTLLDGGDVIQTIGPEGLATFTVNHLATDITAGRLPWVCERGPGHRYFGVTPTVVVVGFPHPETARCPWDESPFPPYLPVVVESATYYECFRPSGGFIDIYTQYPYPFGGQGKDRPSDMFWPQKAIIVCANVTYAQWPEQNKDVAFEIIDPFGDTWGIFVNRTNDDGVACVFIRLPWPCDNPEDYIGEWTIIATVDVACVIVNDTLTFKYDYKVNVWDATVDKEEYKHCEWINVTISYGSYALQPYNITFAITAVDASGVPFGYAYVTVVIGGHDITDYCQYYNCTTRLSVHVVKFARPPMGTIYIAALNGLPQDGGSAEFQVVKVMFAILPEYA